MNLNVCVLGLAGIVNENTHMCDLDGCHFDTRMVEQVINRAQCDLNRR